MPELPKTYPVQPVPDRSADMLPLYALLSHLDEGRHEIKDDMQRGSYSVAYRVVAAYVRQQEEKLR